MTKGENALKTCTRCKSIKPVGEFYSNRSQPDGLANQCKTCAKDVQRAYYAADPERGRQRRRNYMSKYREKYNTLRRKNRREIYIAECARRYHATTNRIAALLGVRNCEICGTPISFSAKNSHKRPNIDHDHSGNEVRGVLCGHCNNMLGMAFDNPETLIKAANYLHERGRKCITT